MGDDDDRPGRPFIVSFGGDIAYGAAIGMAQIAVVLFFAGAGLGGLVVWLVLR